MPTARIFILLLMTVGALSINDSFRLPDVFRPEHYELRILTHINGPDHLRFEGQVKIKFKVNAHINNITLHSKNLTIDETQIIVTSRYGNNCIVKSEFDEDKEFFILQLCELLQDDEHYELMIPFEGFLNNNQSGYYWSSFNNTKTNETNYLAVTQFSPTLARLAFPCFDEPHLKATFNITLGYHKSYIGQSNTPIIKCEKHETLDDYIWCQHEPLFRTSTYLVAYAVHNLTSSDKQTSDTDNNVTFTSWLQPEVVKDGHFLANFAPKVIVFLENLFKFSFPLRKVDQLAVPTHKFSAMENWGLVTFKQSRFTHNDDEETLENKESKASTVGHEYAHQWFGNLITMSWWNDLWLKEGPSTYFGYASLDALLPDWGSGERYIANDLATFFRQDAINSSIAISRDVDNPDSILNQFSEYVYRKGSLIVRMLHKLLGEDVFFSGIRSYVQNHAYSNVSQSDLWQSMQEAVDANGSFEDLRIASVMDTWTKQAGYPLVSVTRDYTTGRVSVNQTRFWLPDEVQDYPEQCWSIPLTFVAQHQANFEETQPQFWLDCPNSDRNITLLKKPAADEWIMLNPQVNTIYRVNYDLKNWRMIIQTLNSTESFNDIHVLNRAQLMDDLMALAWSNLQSYELAFSILEYLPHEDQYVPWKRILDVLGKHGDLLHESQTPIFKVFMQKLIAPLYERCPTLSSINKATTSMQEVALCRLAYAQACRYGVENCISEALKLTIEEVPANYRDIVYSASIEYGDEQQFQIMRQRFQNSTIEPILDMWARGLGCTRNFTLLEPLLDYLLKEADKTTTPYYIQVVSSALSRKHVALETTNHIFQHAGILNDKFSAKNIKSLLMLIIEKGLIAPGDNKLMQLMTYKKFEETVKTAHNLINVNEVWRKQRSDEFTRVLIKYI
ncbi:glutamyl aminopeptidase [Drosophila nasuta]|uniref:glutamyl aminopeptidase n=1 Tax=Drosophila nasuta TaxID=42062 RepID=UPI00295E7BEC|nr:glutamyl aminopeptidase [Drosophila nasuta]